jgi:hypothetical protein
MAVRPKNYTLIDVRSNVGSRDVSGLVLLNLSTDARRCVRALVPEILEPTRLEREKTRNYLALSELNLARSSALPKSPFLLLKAPRAP